VPLVNGDFKTDGDVTASDTGKTVMYDGLTVTTKLSGVDRSTASVPCAANRTPTAILAEWNALWRARRREYVSLPHAEGRNVLEQIACA
jgi:hypothetical protein